MRVWDLPVECLCRSHLLAEHRELHAVWNIILEGKRGYSCHPEVVRWRGKLGALWERHEMQVREMEVRGYSHRSPLDPGMIPRGQRRAAQDLLLESRESQARKLRAKGCECRPGRPRS